MSVYTLSVSVDQFQEEVTACTTQKHFNDHSVTGGKRKLIRGLHSVDEIKETNSPCIYRLFGAVEGN